MGKKSFRLLFLSGICLLLPHFAHQVFSTDELSRICLNSEKEVQSFISSCINNRNILQSIALAIGLLGITTSFFQAINKHSRIIIGSIGVIISSLTLYQHTYFDTSISSYNKIINQYNLYVGRLAYLKDKYSKASLDNKEVIADDILKIYQEILKLNEYLGSQQQKASLFDINVAYADGGDGSAGGGDGSGGGTGGTPQWVVSSQTNPSSIIVVGEYVDSNLKTARFYSYRNALEKMMSAIFESGHIDSLLTNKQLDAKQLAEIVCRNTEISDSYFTTEKKSNDYRYYTLAKLNRNMLDLAANFASNKLSTGEIFTNIFPLTDSGKFEILSTLTEWSEYLIARQSLLINLENQLKQKIGNDDFSKYVLAKKDISQKNYNFAIKNLTSLTSKHPDSYLVWFLLADAYSSSGLDNESVDSFKKAIDLERKLVIKDPAIYNSFGFFLLSHNLCNEAKVQLTKCLDLYPNHSRAKRNLEKANECIKKNAK